MWILYQMKKKSVSSSGGNNFSEIEVSISNNAKFGVSPSGEIFIYPNDYIIFFDFLKELHGFIPIPILNLVIGFISIILQLILMFFFYVFIRNKN